MKGLGLPRVTAAQSFPNYSRIKERDQIRLIQGSRGLRAQRSQQGSTLEDMEAFDVTRICKI